MTVTTISSREFNQDVSRARRAADLGPVIPTIRELLDLPGVEDIEFDPPRLGDGIFRPADLS